MRRVLLMLALAGCTVQRAAPPVVRVDTTAVAVCRAERDTARAQYALLVRRVKRAQFRMHAFAVLVNRKPSQARFIVGWADRAFIDVLPPDSTP